MSERQVNMMSQPEVLRDRTKQIALRIIKLFESMARTEVARVLRLAGLALAHFGSSQLQGDLPRAF